MPFLMRARLRCMMQAGEVRGPDRDWSPKRTGPPQDLRDSHQADAGHWRPCRRCQYTGLASSPSSSTPLPASSSSSRALSTSPSACPSRYESLPARQVFCCPLNNVAVDDPASALRHEAQPRNSKHVSNLTAHLVCAAGGAHRCWRRKRHASRERKSPVRHGHHPFRSDSAPPSALARLLFSRTGTLSTKPQLKPGAFRYRRCGVTGVVRNAASYAVDRLIKQAAVQDQVRWAVGRLPDNGTRIVAPTSFATKRNDAPSRSGAVAFVPIK